MDLDDNFDEVRLLLPLWGRRYRAKFLNHCLPSLLAEGNIPHVAGRKPTIFIIMCPSADVPEIEAHPLWRQISRICEARIEPIDSLVSEASAMSVTLAYTKALREAGDAVTKTLFFFLVADYLLADGALAAALSEIEAGSSALLTGNFVADLDRSAPELEACRGKDGSLAIEPRHLVDIGMRHMHSASKANVIEGDALEAKSENLNRLFWPAGDAGIVGRYFLLHMFAIKPEVASFEISAPCDFSFVPALCPSNRVKTMTDSDRLFLVELQQDNGSLESENVGLDQLAKSVGSWATNQHRSNVEATIFFRRGNDGAEFRSASQRADRFISALSRKLPHTAVGPTWHPYWLGMLEHYRATAHSPLGNAELNCLLTPFSDTTLRANRRGTLGWFRYLVFGTVPTPRHWHPRWQDWRVVEHAFNKHLAGQSVCIIGASSQSVAQGLAALASRAGAASVKIISQNSLRGGSQFFDVCVTELDPADRDLWQDTVDDLTAVLNADGKLVALAGCLSRQVSSAVPSLELEKCGAYTVSDTLICPLSAERLRLQEDMLASLKAVVTVSGAERIKHIPKAARSLATATWRVVFDKPTTDLSVGASTRVAVLERNSQRRPTVAKPGPASSRGAFLRSSDSVLLAS